MPRLREARELREWRHWSNLEEQAELIRRARALAEVEDLERVDRELAALERAWHKARHTGRDRGQELWEEWGKVREGILERIGPLREAAERELGEKLDGLRAIVEKAEEIAESTDPRRAAELRELMPEWRQRARGIGKRSERLWKRFRAANDRYFSELKVLRKKRYEEFAANIPIREELIARAKALFEQTDAETVRNAVRDLMREWKEFAPRPPQGGRPPLGRFPERLRRGPGPPPGGGGRRQVGPRRSRKPPPEAKPTPALRARITELADPAGRGTARRGRLTLGRVPARPPLDGPPRPRNRRGPSSPASGRPSRRIRTPSRGRASTRSNSVRGSRDSWQRWKRSPNPALRFRRTGRGR